MKDLIGGYTGHDFSVLNVYLNEEVLSVKTQLPNIFKGARKWKFRDFSCSHYFVDYGFISVCIFYLFKTSFSSFCVLGSCLFCYEFDVIFVKSLDNIGVITAYIGTRCSVIFFLTAELLKKASSSQFI